MALYYYHRTAFDIPGIPAHHTESGSTLAYYRTPMFSPSGL